MNCIYDKAPQPAVINALAELDIRGTAIRWFQSFLSKGTQQVRVNNFYSTVGRVASSVLQGSVEGPGLYTVSINSLFLHVRLPDTAFADDFKFCG